MEDERRKSVFKRSDKYFTISIYTIIVVIICAILVKAIFNFAETLGFFKDLLNGLAPFMVGILIAYCINPLYNWLYHKAFKKLFRGKCAKFRKYFSILISYVIFVGVIVSLLVYIIPNILNSVNDLVENAKSFSDKAYDWFEKTAKKYPDLDLERIEKSLESAYPTAIDFIQNSATNIGTKIYGTSKSVLSWIYNILMGFVVSFYLILDKKSMIRSLKRLIYAIFSEKHARIIISNLRESNDIFSDFIIGKFIDSSIIGVICFVVCTVLHIDYALIVSMVVGITNMIPYIGPFIGGFIGGLLLLVVAPGSLVKFVILVIILQQFDGFILGPMILGDKTGLRPFWILFAVTLGGWVGGILGMFLGVPIVAVVANLVDKFVNARLVKKGLIVPKIYASQKLSDRDERK